MQSFGMRIALGIFSGSMLVAILLLYFLYRMSDQNIYAFWHSHILFIFYILLIGGFTQPVIGLIWRFVQRRAVRWFDLSIFTLIAIYIATGTIIVGLLAYISSANGIMATGLIGETVADNPLTWMAFITWWLFGFFACLNIVQDTARPSR